MAKQQQAERLIKEHFLDEFKDYLADHSIKELENDQFMDDSGNWHNWEDLVKENAIDFMENDLGLIWKDNKWVKPTLPGLEKVMESFFLGTPLE